LFCVDCVFNAFLGEFAKLRKAAINFVMSVHPSICPSSAWNNSALAQRIFMKFDPAIDQNAYMDA